MTPDAVGVCYPTDGTGVLFINAPECPLTFRSGERPGQSPFVGLRFEVGQFSEAGVLTSAALLVPLSGDLLTAAGQALAAYRAGSEAPGMPAAEPSGRCLARLNEGVLWTDVATAKVLPDEPPPTATVAAVEIAAARGEFGPFQLALRLTVRGFVLPEERSLAAFLDPWRQCVEKHYGKDKTAAIWPPFGEHLAGHRAAPLHPVGGGPPATWDDQGNLTSFDGAPLAAALEAYWRDDRMPVAVLGTFTLGWGHLPRDNRFGKAADILSPLWQARCSSYATALRDHLRAREWAGKVVFSLFDEPSPEYYPLITGTVDLLRGIAPEWRFTYWGNRAPQLDGAIRVWTITAWVEWTGNDRFWDPYRNASWVVPGPDAPLDTIRFELAREGLEDYEYLVLLETLTAQAETRGLRDAAATGRRLLDESRGIAWAPEDGRTAILHTRDPRPLHDLRDRLGAAITDLTAALQP